MIFESDHNTLISCLSLWRIILTVVRENDALLSGLGVVVLQHAIHTHVSVKDVHICIRIQFLDMKGILDCALTADAGAVGVLLISGSHALDHDHFFKVIGPFHFQPFSQFDLGHHTVVLSIEIFGWFIFICSGGQDHNAMVDLALIHSRPHHNLCGEIPLESAESHYKGFREHLYFFVVSYLIHQFQKVSLNILTLYGGRQIPGKTT